MIAFQSMRGEMRYLAGLPVGVQSFATVALLSDAFPWHESDEKRLRAQYVFLRDFRTVTYSSRIDRTGNNLARMSREELTERYPIKSKDPT